MNVAGSMASQHVDKILNDTTELSQFTTSASTSTDFYDIDYVDMFTDEGRRVIINTYIWMGVLGAVINALTILIIASGKATGKDLKIQLINIAVADLLMALFDPSYSASVYTRQSFPDNIHLCRLYRFTRHAAHYGGLVSRLVASIEISVMVFSPVRAARYKRTHKILVVVFIWLLAWLAGAGDLVDADVTEYDGEINCVINLSPLMSADVDSWLTMLEYVLPAFIIVIVSLLFFIRKLMHRSSEYLQHSAKHQANSSEKVKFVFNSSKIMLKNKLIEKFVCGWNIDETLWCL